MVESTAAPESTPTLPEGGHALGHGHSVAAWTAVAIILIGTLVAALAVIFTSVWLFVAGAVVVVLGALAGKLLSVMGFGATASH
jgi:hypothetical protein